MNQNSVMVVDDDPITRHMLRMFLELEGYEVTEAEDGKDALQKVGELKPDIMILDVMMPNMDGITACKSLRACPETARMPVIMLSGKTHSGADEEGLAAGANVYMKKPMDVKQLLVAIQSCVVAAVALSLAT